MTKRSDCAGFSAIFASQRGMTLIDTVAVLTLFGILSAIAVPSITSAIDSTRLAQATREVERELQVAKSRAVGKSRPIRIRFNCPAAGMYRITELIGTAVIPAVADTAANRCNQATYPFPPADTNPLTLPNLDGPVRLLSSEVTFVVAPTIEFWPDGTAHYDTGIVPWQMVPVNGINIRLERKGVQATITVNGLGRIQVQ
jgi:Tfp pilus assembly protein FimT